MKLLINKYKWWRYSEYTISIENTDYNISLYSYNIVDENILLNSYSLKYCLLNFKRIPENMPLLRSYYLTRMTIKEDLELVLL